MNQARRVVGMAIGSLDRTLLADGRIGAAHASPWLHRDGCPNGDAWRRPLLRA
jgi:hypothetical protein